MYICGIKIAYFEIMMTEQNIECNEVDKVTTTSSSNVVVNTPINNFNVLNLFDEKQLAAAENFLKRVMTTDKGGIKNVNEGLAILMRAQDLNLPFSTCIEHIHVIQGKTGIDVHIIRSLLSRAGVTWECIKDYAPQYNYTDGNTIYAETQLPSYCIKCRSSKEAEEKTNDDYVGVYPVKYYQDLNGNIYNELQINDKCTIALNRVQAMQLAKDKKFPILRINPIPVDYVTEYKFTRYRIILGEKIKQECISHFSLNEAKQAELIDKENYKKYARIMVANRAFTLGAREIADDVLMGAFETTELKIITDQPLSNNDFVEAEVVN